MSTTNDADRAAEELTGWFGDLLRLCDATVFAVASEPAHRKAAVLGVLTRNAKRLYERESDSTGKLFTPLCLVLASACRSLDLVPDAGQWKAAIENVLVLGPQLRKVVTNMPVIVSVAGSPAALLKEHLDESLAQAGVTDRATILDHRNRRIALGLAINWGMRFLVAYALETTDPPEADAISTRGLSWIRKIIQPIVVRAA
ncbi:hypothetical protein WME75_01510 [Sorangium sp. So ce1014]|uniref:hypothetical protein n=1 Tax=Sorangium sp. So ce1014 TaxID=3133326 RepID=UPI003F5DEE84